eukprot:NODE_822_length_1308_cov_13.621922_g623_i0.p1 GENE.NODE_822_length_1308_cov_13.621922_g623_i0~~NODE_822_length_1308_cov_13.621922_g623_i0.p1  ORF type:complete len:346 (-),score=60.32 NODE_822_length_1308_cov_13.621922_g623_i0:197-1234(-)
MGCCSSNPSTPVQKFPQNGGQIAEILFLSEGAPKLHLAEFQRFCQNFLLQDAEAENILKVNPLVDAVYKEQVPSNMSRLEFWRRYFFKAEHQSSSSQPAASAASGGEVSVTSTTSSTYNSRSQPSSSKKNQNKDVLSKKYVELQHLFDKYKAVGISEGGEESVNALQAGSFPPFAEDLGVELEDLIMLIIPFKLDCKSPYRISYDEWMNGWLRLRATNLEGMKSQLPDLRQEVLHRNFKPFYNFVFVYAKDPTQKSMDYQTACGTWRLLMRGKYTHLDLWCCFVEEKYKKSISQDQWNQFYDFTQSVDDSFSTYDVDGAWPVLLDEFVDHARPLVQTTHSPSESA